MVDHVDLRYVICDNSLVDKKCLKSLRYGLTWTKTCLGLYVADLCRLCDERVWLRTCRIRTARIA